MLQLYAVAFRELSSFKGCPFGEVSTVYSKISCSWGLHDADVVCRMSGHQSAQSAPRGSFFGGGIGVIWFDDFICTGHEESLLDCSHSGVKVHDCNHGEDASAVCSGELRLCNVCRLVYSSLYVFVKSIAVPSLAISLFLFHRFCSVP